MTKYFRSIAARGLTPEHRGVAIGQEGRIYGALAYYEHFEGGTVVGIWQEDTNLIVEYDFQHLDTVEVYA